MTLCMSGTKLNQDKASHSSHAQARWWVIFLLFTGTFINAIDRASLSIAAPNMMAELHMDPGMMGIALSAFFWSYIIMNIPAGGMADKFGAKRTLGWAAGLWSICSAFTGMATQYLHVVLARIGVGVGEAASFPVNARIVTNSFPSEQRGTAEALNTAFEFLADAASPEFHPVVEKAKDVAAGAVLLAAVGAAVIGFLILGPYCLKVLS